MISPDSAEIIVTESQAIDLTTTPSPPPHISPENNSRLVEPPSCKSSVTSTCESDSSTSAKVVPIKGHPSSKEVPTSQELSQMAMKNYTDSMSLLPTGSAMPASYPGFDQFAMAAAFPGMTPDFYGDAGLPGLGSNPLSMYMSHLTNRKRKSTDSIRSNETKSRSNSGDKEKAASSTSDEGKDEAYWDRRRKNNEAAKRSRDARRQKEEEIAVRAAYLEQENLKLRAQVTILKTETAKLHYLLYNRNNTPSSNSS